MTDDEVNKLAKAVAKATVEEVFSQMSTATGKGILKRLWWIVLALVAVLGFKFGIIKLP